MLTANPRLRTVGLRSPEYSVINQTGHGKPVSSGIQSDPGSLGFGVGFGSFGDVLPGGIPTYPNFLKSLAVEV